MKMDRLPFSPIDSTSVRLHTSVEPNRAEQSQLVAELDFLRNRITELEDDNNELQLKV
jgi:hypothetical protein